MPAVTPVPPGYLGTTAYLAAPCGRVRVTGCGAVRMAFLKHWARLRLKRRPTRAKLPKLTFSRPPQSSATVRAAAGGKGGGAPCQAARRNMLPRAGGHVRRCPGCCAAVVRQGHSPHRRGIDLTRQKKGANVCTSAPNLEMKNRLKTVCGAINLSKRFGYQVNGRPIQNVAAQGRAAVYTTWPV